MRRRARKRRTTTAWCVRVISLGRAGQGRASTSAIPLVGSLFAAR